MPGIDHRELERRSQDTIAVYNPTDSPFIVPWNSFQNVIPPRTKDVGYGPGVQRLPRYIANRYVSKMIDDLLGRENLAAIAAENADRLSKGLKEMNRWEELPAFEGDRSASDPDRRRAVLKTLWRGVVHEFGLDQLEEATAPVPFDARPSDQQLLDELDSVAYQDIDADTFDNDAEVSQPEPIIESRTEKAKQSAIEEVAA